MAVFNHSAELLLLAVWTLCPYKGCHARIFGQYARKMSDVRPLFQALHDGNNILPLYYTTMAMLCYAHGVCSLEI